MQVTGESAVLVGSCKQEVCVVEVLVGDCT